MYTRWIPSIEIIKFHTSPHTNSNVQRGPHAIPMYKRAGGHMHIPMYKRAGGHMHIPMYKRAGGHMHIPMYKRAGGHMHIPRKGGIFCPFVNHIPIFSGKFFPMFLGQSPEIWGIFQKLPKKIKKKGG